MGNTSKNVEVVIVGAGLLGLSTAYHLKQFAPKTKVIIIDWPEHGVTGKAAGWLSAGMMDNFTRLDHLCGNEGARQVWDFGDRAYRELVRFAVAQKLLLHSGDRERLIVSDHELEEAKLADQLLQKAGLQSRFEQPVSTACHLSRVIARQCDGVGGGFLDPLQLLSSLRKLAGADFISDWVTRVQRDRGPIEVVCKSGSRYTCEMAVLSNHLGVRALIPELAEAFVPVAEQWLEAELEEPLDLRPGYTFSANHGYEWGVFLSQTLCRIGGGRFLRKLAGIGAESAPIDARITKFLVGRLEETFAGLKVKRVTQEASGLECRPCDELPIVGPMFGDARLLLAGGFMGQGLTQAFLAGKCMASLIASGESPDLPRLIYPERLRSL